MEIGDKVRITDEAWAAFCADQNLTHRNPGIRQVEDIHPSQNKVMLDFPFHWWDPEDLQTTNLVVLDDIRIREEQEFEDEKVAYVEALWGKETFAFNAAIRDLEAMRRGADDLSLRPPQTYHEAAHLVLHIRALANDLARHFGMDDLVRESDDLGGGDGGNGG